jgi:hypothetical protein
LPKRGQSLGEKRESTERRSLVHFKIILQLNLQESRLKFIFPLCYEEFFGRKQFWIRIINWSFLLRWCYFSGVFQRWLLFVFPEHLNAPIAAWHADSIVVNMVCLNIPMRLYLSPESLWEWAVFLVRSLSFNLIPTTYSWIPDTKLWNHGAL